MKYKVGSKEYESSGPRWIAIDENFSLYGFTLMMKSDKSDFPRKAIIPDPEKGEPVNWFGFSDNGIPTHYWSF